MHSPGLRRSLRISLSITLAALLFAAEFPASAQQSADAAQSPYQQRRGGGRGNVRGMYKSRIVPNWFAGNNKFWYRNDLRAGDREFILVDAAAGKREPAFDHEKLAAALTKAADKEYSAKKLPFDSLRFSDDVKEVRFTVEGKSWKVNLETYECSAAEEPAATSRGDEAQTDAESLANLDAELELGLLAATSSPAPEEILLAQQRGARGMRGGPGGRGFGGRGNRGNERSRDGKWTAFIKENNLFIRSNENNEEIQVSKDGAEGNAYGMPQWSPDGKTLVAFRIVPGDRKEVHLLASSPAGGGRARLESRPYPLPGDKFTSYELKLFNAESREEIKTDVEKIDFGQPRLRWRPDDHSFTYEKVDRGHQRLRLVEVDAQTGKSRNLIDEQTKTFIWTAHTENVGIDAITWLAKADEILYVSERDGWRHLYLIDPKTGELKNQVTKGEYVVRGVDLINEDNRQIWFQASGKIPNLDPYFVHFYRVNFDGTGLVQLTEGDGEHSVAYSPDQRFIIDTYQRVDMPPVNELRRVEDGSLVCKLEESDIAELKENGWEAPEVFVSKGRDGQTDIWGIICRPRGFDPAKKYPIIEQIYAGPQGSFTPKTFSPARRFASLTDLGFIVVQMDGMGTANRSKAFHDVCWHNLKDAGFPDRILWHKAVAAKYSWYDSERVGIYGGSAGGQNATGAVLFHPEFYKAAVSGCGCHDNRMDKASWNEQWMGYPVGPQYSASSNIDNASRLKGKLLLIVGEMDSNVPPEATYRLVDALIKAGKDFEFVMVPGAGHGMGGQYGDRKLRDFFVKHLQGVEPPNRNAQSRGAE